MKKYLFSSEEVDLIQYIKLNNPVKVWLNIIHYIFEYNNFYIKFEIECCEKFLLGENFKANITKAENGNYNIFEQYVMGIKVEKVSEFFKPNKSYEEINSKEKIVEVFVVRSLCFFTKHKVIKGNVNKTYSKDSGIINPNMEIDESIDAEKRCLVDVGIVIVSETSKFLNCFLLNNDEDFGINEFYLYDNLIETEKQKYEFLKL